MGVNRRPWRLMAAGLCGLLLSGTLVAELPRGKEPFGGNKSARRIFLDCMTEATDEYAGVEFKYAIDEATETLRVSRWGEPVEVKFGPSYITYRTTGMALKMSVAINRETWHFTMLHEGGVFVVTGVCKEAAQP